MPYDSFIKVAPDNAEGNAVDMDLVATAAGVNVRRQRAVLVGETGDQFQALLLIQMQQLQVLRAMLTILRADHPGSLGEEDFAQDLTPNDY
jgi:hypothetical protein